ncbi:MAG: AsmA family protein, partial [Calditrichaeota bacterium]
PDKITDLTGEMQFSNDKLTIKSLSARVGRSPLELSGSVVNLQNPTVDVRIKTDMQLDEIGKYTSLPEGTQLAGRMHAALRVRGPANDPEHARFQGTIKLAEGSLTSPDLSVPVTDVSANLKFTGQNVQISTLAFKAGKSSATITGKIVDPVNHPKGHLTLVSPVLDLDELLPSSSPETPQAAEPSSSHPVKLPFEALDGEVRVKKLITNEMALNDVRAKVRIRDNVLHIENLTSGLYSGRLTGNATGDFNDPSGLAYDVTLKCKNVDVNNFASSVIPMKDTFFGNMDLEMKAQGRGLSAAAMKESLVGEGSTVISRGKLARLDLLRSLAGFLNLPSFENLRFNTLKSRFELKDRKVAFDRLNLSAFGNDISVEGFMGLDGALNFSVSMLLSEELTQRFRQKAVNVPSFLLVDSRRLPIDLIVTGSTESPAIAWDTEKALRRSAETHVQRGLQSLLSGFKKKPAESTVAEKDTSSARQDTLQVRKAEKTEEPVKEILRGLGGLFGKKKKKKQ